MTDFLSQTSLPPPIKAIVMSDSGGGKTGALASLAAAGYRLRVLDTDGVGSDILRNVIIAQNSPYKPPKGGYDISVVKVTEKMKNRGGVMVPAAAKAWDNCMSALEKWKDGDADLGSITDWDEDTVFVADTLSSLSTFAMNKVLFLNARTGQQPYESDWGEAQRYLEGFLQTLSAKEIRCNVVMNCHLVYIGPRDDKGKSIGEDKGYPNTLGKALSPKVGRYFNHTLFLDKGKFHTKSRNSNMGLVDVKTSSPFTVKPTYDLAFGLADYFKDVTGKFPQRKEQANVPPIQG